MNANIYHANQSSRDSTRRDSGTRDIASDWKAAGVEANSSFVRPASPDDADACVAIYRPYVENTAITFETSVPAPSEMGMRIRASRDAHEWLVLEHHDVVVGYAYTHAVNPRAAYQRSDENMDGLRRDYFPKRTDLRDLTHTELQRVAGGVNMRPRKSLS